MHIEPYLFFNGHCDEAIELSAKWQELQQIAGDRGQTPSRGFTRRVRR